MSDVAKILLERAQELVRERDAALARAEAAEAEVERLTAEVERLRRALAELQVAVEDLEDSGARGVPALITAASRAVAVLRLQDAQAALAAQVGGGGE